jgi:arabinose-5-phosphate isomerase
LLVKDIMITGKKLPVVNINKNIYEAIKVIESKRLGLVIVMEKNQVKGILTDGDTRRGVKYYSKDDHLKKFMTSNPLFTGDFRV